jgi:hypothetical protein
VLACCLLLHAHCKHAEETVKCVGQHSCALCQPTGERRLEEEEKKRGCAWAKGGGWLWPPQLL